MWGKLLSWIVFLIVQKHDFTRLIIWGSKDSSWSSITPRFLAKWTNLTNAPWIIIWPSREGGKIINVFVLLEFKHKKNLSIHLEIISKQCWISSPKAAGRNDFTSWSSAKPKMLNIVGLIRVGTSGKIVWKLRNVWKSLEIVWSFECFRNFVIKMSGNSMKILYNPIFY